MKLKIVFNNILRALWGPRLTHVKGPHDGNRRIGRDTGRRDPCTGDKLRLRSMEAIPLIKQHQSNRQQHARQHRQLFEPLYRPQERDVANRSLPQYGVFTIYTRALRRQISRSTRDPSKDFGDVVDVNPACGLCLYY